MGTWGSGFLEGDLGGRGSKSYHATYEILAAMSILKVARMGHPVLRARATPLEPADIKSPRVQQLIDDMFETMQEYQGVGLAAPKVDDEDDDEEEDERVPLMALINPEITIVGDETADEWEGCLSIPDIRGRVT